MNPASPGLTAAKGAEDRKPVCKENSRVLPSAALAHPPRALIVDDEENVAEIFLELFKEKGYRADSAYTGEDGVKKIMETRYDLVLTDINLPGVDGLEVVKAAKAKNEKTCVIVITGYASTRTAIDALRQGAYDYVTKPFDLWEVAQTIERGLSSQRLTIENELLLERLKVANEELKSHKETLIEKIELATRRMRTLYEFGKEITSSLSLENTCNSIAAKVKRLVVSDKVFLFLFDESTNQFFSAAEVGIGNGSSGDLKCSPDEGFLGRALSSGTPTVEVDPKLSLSNGTNSIFDKSNVLLVLPLLTLGEKIGGLLLVRGRDEVFSKEEVEILALFGSQAAIAISNAKLFEKTKELDRLKSEFVAVVSHELRTPLTSIKGSLELLKDERLFRPDEKQKELLNICEANAVRLVKLVSDILDFSKMEASKLLMKFELTNISHLVRECVKSVENLARQHDLSLLVELPGRDVFAEADGSRLGQVVTNLLSNAIKFSESKAKVFISITEREEEIEIRVKDEGPGIAPQELRKLFKKFQQLDGSTTRKAGGTGLGLVISKGIVEQHGGRIWVESEPGKGSTFAFTVPLKQTALEKKDTEEKLASL